MSDFIFLKMLQFVLLKSRDKIDTIKRLFDGLMNDTFYQLVLDRINKSDLKFINVLRTCDIYKIINYLKEIDTYIDDMNPVDYFNIPTRYIKKIVEKLDQLEEVNTLNYSLKDEPIILLARTGDRTIEEVYTIACKLYLTIGLDNTLELLNGYYGDVSYQTIFHMFNEIDISDDDLNSIFVNFLFSNKKDDNNVMRKILGGKANGLFLNFSYFRDNLAKYISILGESMALSKVLLLLKDRFITSDPFHPNITRDISSDMVSSYKNKYEYSMDSDADIKSANINFYKENIMGNYISSIPDYMATDGELYCETLSRNDPKLLVIGYRTNNCFRMNGDAFILFKKAIKSKHMRVLVISTKFKKDIAMVLLGRNGNVLIGQGIEISVSFRDKEYRERIYNIIKKFMKELMDEMNKNDDEIVATVIGNSNANVMEFNSSVLPFIITSIIDNSLNDNYYNGFNHYQYLLDLYDNKTLRDIKLYTPSKEYYGARKSVSYFKGKYLNIEAERIIFSISCQANTQIRRINSLSKHDMVEIYYNDDWYVIVLDNGEIESACLDYDERARYEYNACLDNLKIKLDVKKRYRP